MPSPWNVISKASWQNCFKTVNGNKYLPTKRGERSIDFFFSILMEDFC